MQEITLDTTFGEFLDKLEREILEAETQEVVGLNHFLPTRVKYEGERNGIIFTFEAKKDKQ